jgi:ubiquinone/menaquinone biosynthesis C-methylase UbiE
LRACNQGLVCDTCASVIETSKHVIDFLSDSPIAESFGFQWNKFPRVQLDSFSLDKRSEERFRLETNWDSTILGGKLVLDAGCGSGRFSEVAIKDGAHLIALDASEAVFAAQNNLAKNQNVIFVRADLRRLPFEDGVFDFVYCIGVLQHTSNPWQCIEELSRVTSVGGQIALTFYEKKIWTRLYSKYLVRPLTKRVPKALLLRLISSTSVIWFPITNRLFRLPGFFGKVFRFVIPVANYVDYTYTNSELQKVEAILDTFDMLSPEFDSPLKKTVVLDKLKSHNFVILSSHIKGNIRAEKK